MYFFLHYSHNPTDLGITFEAERSLKTKFSFLALGC